MRKISKGLFADKRKDLVLRRNANYWEMEFIANSFEIGFVDDDAYSIETSLLTFKFSDMKYLTTSVYNCYYLSNPFFASLRRLEDLIAVKEAFKIS
jgi:Golgi nucleoside diphosphatase